MVDPIKPESFSGLSELELRLVQVRAEAREARLEAQAARLEAQAARLERLLRSYAAEGSNEALSKEVRYGLGEERFEGDGCIGVEHAASANISGPDSGVHVESFTKIESGNPSDDTLRWPRSWDEFLVCRSGRHEDSAGPLQESLRLNGLGLNNKELAESSRSCPDERGASASEGTDARSRPTSFVGPQSPGDQRIDQGERVRKPKQACEAEQQGQADGPQAPESASRKDQADTAWPSSDFLKRGYEPETQTPSLITRSTAADSAGFLQKTKLGEVGVSRRRRPAALGISLGLHAIALVVFAGITLTSQLPKDAMVLSASQADDRFEMQVTEFESVVIAEAPALETPGVPQLQSNEALAALTEASELVLPVTSSPAAIPTPTLGARSLLGDSGLADSIPQDVSTQFFGLEGGGNTFVYLVDSSRSMDDVSRDGFDVARNELLRAVDQLNENQKFYVMFFGEETWEMPIGDRGEGSPRLVSASRESKESLRRWALSLQMQPGAWPREALQIAFKLRPDCIFLLTDGAMSENVIPLVKQENIVTTLFDGPKPRSIIHTIGFHNPEGEARLREIANLSGGAYRFVPPTRSARR